MQDKDGDWTDIYVSNGGSQMFSPEDKHKRWFIDIPGAPEELKPVLLSENPPNENGYYIVHTKYNNQWDRWWLDKDNICMWDDYVDWFIPYRISSLSEEK